MTLSSLIVDLHRIGAIRFGEFTLKSGILSPVYVDLRLTVSYPNLLKAVSTMMWDALETTDFDLICGVPYTALPIATCMSQNHAVPMVMRRREVKDYGTKKAIEGAFASGQKCLVVEDLVTSGSSVLETITDLEAAGLEVQDIVVLLDREQGGADALESRGYRLHSALKFSQVLDVLEENRKISKEEAERVRTFLMANQV